MNMSSSEINFLYLSEEDMRKSGVMDMPKCIDAMEEVLKCMSLGDYVMGGENHASHGCMVTFPQQSPFPNMPKQEGEDRRFMAMPAYIGGPFDLMGMKWYGSNVKNKEKELPRSILMIMLNDKDTGAPLCLMSGNLVSAQRTGAVQGVGSRHLARPDSRVCAIYGPGVMGKTALDAFMATCKKLDTIKVKGRGKRSLNSFIQYVREKYPQIKEIVVTDSLEELIRDSDIVTFTATTNNDVSTYAKVQKEWVKPGALLVCPSGVEFETEFLAKECKLVVDSMGLYHAWREEYPYPTYGAINIIGCKFMDLVHEGKITEAEITDMGDVLLGKSAGRSTEEEIIVYSVGGMPVEDVAWGKICYEKALACNIGVKLNLWDHAYMW